MFQICSAVVAQPVMHDPALVDLLHPGDAIDGSSRVVGHAYKRGHCRLVVNDFKRLRKAVRHPVLSADIYFRCSRMKSGF
jgi:hypothetical protein